MSTVSHRLQRDIVVYSFDRHHTWSQPASREIDSYGRLLWRRYFAVLGLRFRWRGRDKGVWRIQLRIGSHSIERAIEWKGAERSAIQDWQMFLMDGCWCGESDCWLFDLRLNRKRCRKTNLNRQQDSNCSTKDVITQKPTRWFRINRYLVCSFRFNLFCAPPPSNASYIAVLRWASSSISYTNFHPAFYCYFLMYECFKVKWSPQVMRWMYLEIHRSWHSTSYHCHRRHKEYGGPLHSVLPILGQLAVKEGSFFATNDVLNM